MIRPENIYHMLGYVFGLPDGHDRPHSQGDRKFENDADLCAAILGEGIKKQVRQGIRKGYVPQTASLALLRGRLDWPASLKSGGVVTRRLVCAYDEFLPDIHLNRILKTTLAWLLKAPLSRERKCSLAALLPYFKDVQELDPERINWRIQYDRNTHSYRLLMYICSLVLQGLVQRHAGGSVTVHKDLGTRALDKMHDLYERFVRAYYQRHFPETHPKTSSFRWATDDGRDVMLPQMKTDVQLTYKKKILIIDTKYYNASLQLNKYNTSEPSTTASKTLISQHLYQIFCYVKNMAAHEGKSGHEVSGLLLYALTEDGALEQSYEMCGNRIGVRTLDLGSEFSRITEQLNAIARDYLGCSPTG